MSDSESAELEELQAKHRKEKKELQAKIQAMKKNVSKDRKKKIVEEIANLETNLEKKHTQEIAELNKTRNQCKEIESEVKNLNISAEEIDNEPSHQRISKAQKRREKKAIEEKLRDAEISAQEELNKNGPRLLELAAIKALLKSRGLSIYSIHSDGDCLYNAIIHQLKLFEKTISSVKELRHATADYIEKNKIDLMPYMTSASGDSITDEEFDKYCYAIRTTPAWGGQIEIQALSHILQVPIEVLQSSGPPTVQGEDDYKAPNLVITYHRHMYSLGEHYNSTKPYEEDEVVN